ncbi:MAG: LysR family transcriptional regulator [Clostridiales bacterium]|nr:LysR family transcriptional regulator [Clostridiales bacterium]
MTDRSLIVFKTVAEHGSNTKAAQILNVSPSTVWRTIIELEREFDTRLFVKGSNPLKLTTQGAYLKNLIDNGLHTTQRFSRFIEMYKNPHIAIGLSFPSGLNTISSRLIKLRDRNPDVFIHPGYGDSRYVRDKLVNKEVDFAVLPERISILDYKLIKTIDKYEWGITAPSGVPLTDRAYLTCEQIMDTPVIFPTESSCLRAISDWMGFEVSTIRSNTYNDSNSLLDMIKSGFGIAFAPIAERQNLVNNNLAFYYCYPKIFTSLYIYSKCDGTESKAAESLKIMIESDKV